MKAYYITYKTYINGKLEGQYGSCLHLTEDLDTEEVLFNWDNLDDFSYKFGMVLPFNVWHIKGKKKIEFFDNIFNTLKEGKHELNGKLVIEYKEANPSIKDIINYHDGEKAIKYLVERGLTISL